MIIIESNGLTQDSSGGGDVFVPIKNQMLTVTEDNIILKKENQALRAQLISLQLEVERQEEIVKSFDPEYVQELRRSYEERQKPPDVPTIIEELDDSELIKEAQEIFLSGQYMDIDEEQRLWELQLYDLQYHKQELEIDLQEKQAKLWNLEELKQRELQVLEENVKESVKKEKNMRQMVVEAEKMSMAYVRKIDMLKIENQMLRKKINYLKDLLSQ